MDKEFTVAHVILNNLGGITSLIQNLIIYKDSEALPQELIIINVEGDIRTTAFIDDRIKKNLQYFNLYPRENWYHIYQKLYSLLNRQKGILISNDQFDLMMLRAFNIDRKVIQIVHDDYNLTLSQKFENCIDKFIAHSRYIYDKLHDVIPHRKDDIELIRYGIPVSEAPISKCNEINRLNLLFLGRHDIGKGIYDVFEIENLLKSKGVDVNWNILGKGPESEKVKQQWTGKQNVNFKTPESFDEVMREIESNDILVFPSKFEGFPVAILESMSRGCVPVATNLPGGIQEVVTDGITGYKCAINNNDEFATRIEMLHKDRGLLRKMQNDAINFISNNFEVKKQTRQYQAFFKRVLNEDQLPRHHQVNEKIGSRLDQPWLPNLLTKTIRKLIY